MDSHATTVTSTVSKLAAPVQDLAVDEWQAVDSFLRGKVQSRHTRRAYRRHLARFVEWCRGCGVATPAAITPAVLADYRSELVEDETVTNSTRAQAVTAVRSFVLWARAFAPHLPDGDMMRQVFAVPAARIDRPYITLTDDEVARLLEAARASSPRDLAIVALMVGAGLRVSEVVRLSPSRLIESPDASVVLFCTGKGEKDRHVPAGPDLVEILRAHLAEDGRMMDQLDTRPMFRAADRAAVARGSWGRSLSEAAVDYLVRKLVKEAGIRAKRISCHSLRHTFACRFLRAGGDVRALQKILGHASLTTTQRYVDHLELAELASAMPALPRGNKP